MPKEQKTTNQYTAHDPRQAEFLKHYLDPKSDTFGNATQSGIRAGYTEEYSKTIIGRELDWLSDYIKDTDLVRKAEKNLNKFLGEEFSDDKIKADITKFVLERLNKAKYSTKQEVEHSGGIKNIEEVKLDKETTKFLEAFINKRKKKI